MKQNLALIFILCLGLLICGCSQPETIAITETTATKIELKDNWYYLNGEKFFIKAIGYEIGARPGQHPYEDEKKDYLELMKFSSIDRPFFTDIAVTKRKNFTGWKSDEKELFVMISSKKSHVLIALNKAVESFLNRFNFFAFCINVSVVFI